MRSLDHCAAEEINLAGVLYALADPVRLRIARVLCDGGEHVQADFPADVSQSTLSHHMKRLRQAGIAWSRPEFRTMARDLPRCSRLRGRFRRQN